VEWQYVFWAWSYLYSYLWHDLRNYSCFQNAALWDLSNPAVKSGVTLSTLSGMFIFSKCSADWGSVTHPAKKMMFKN
jgi:hypothetical protein